MSQQQSKISTTRLSVVVYPPNSEYEGTKVQNPRRYIHVHTYNVVYLYVAHALYMAGAYAPVLCTR